MKPNPAGCAESHDSTVPFVTCESLCRASTSTEDLNRDCFCVSVDPDAVRASLAVAMADHSLPADFAHSHANLFASLPVYLSDAHIYAMGRVASGIEATVSLPTYQDAALNWAPEIARFDPGSPGGLLGLDFHLGADGPRLIEINTNPGGILLNALLAQAQRPCMPERVRSALSAEAAEASATEVLREEWRAQRGEARLRRIAIVDDAPEAQYLFPEFLLYRELLRRRGIDAVICDPAQLRQQAGRITTKGQEVDMVYNRLTDFSLARPEHRFLRDAYLGKALVISPHPRAHALYADKRNLILLGDREFLLGAGCAPEVADLLSVAVPQSLLLTDDNRGELWTRRSEFFFKPAAGFGSRASYRGDKLTRRVWEDMAANTYIAQRVVAPGLRHVGASDAPLKVDIRCYAYRGKPLLFAARLYRGQTTNFRTAGGGFAPVLKLIPPADSA